MRPGRYTVAVLLALFGLVAVQLLVGLWSARRIRTEDDFLVAGRRLGPIMATGSIFATWFGAESCIGAAGSAYEDGITWSTTEPFAYGACLVLLGVFFAGRLWRLHITTLPDFFRQRFGRAAERVAAVLLLPSSILWAAAQIRAFGHVVVDNAGGAITLPWAILIAAAVAVAYTATGGLLADVQTDLLQGVLLITGIIVLALWVPWFDTAGPTPPVQVPAGEPLSRLDLFEVWAIPICGSILAQEAVSRTLAARSAVVARNAAIFGGLLYVAVGSLVVAIGAAGPRLLPGLDDAETLLPQLSRIHLPTVLHFVFAGALVSAILSTVDSCLLVASSVITRNLTKRPADDGTGRGRLGLARIATCAAGLAAFVLATSGANVHDLVEEASGFGTAGIFVLGVAGIYSRFGGAFAACLSLLGGLLAWIAGRHVFAGTVSHPYLTSLAAAAAGFLLGCLIERLRRAIERLRRRPPR